MNKLNLTLNEKSTKVTRQIKIIIHYRTYLGVNICLREKQKCKKRQRKRNICYYIIDSKYVIASNESLRSSYTVQDNSFSDVSEKSTVSIFTGIY